MILKFKLLSVSVLAACSVSSSAFGATIVGAGTFNLTGSAVGTITGIDFYHNTLGDQLGAVTLPNSGVFSDLMPTPPGPLQTIQDLTAANGVIPGTMFDFKNWIQLTDGINLDVTNIPVPSSFPVCTTSSPETTGYQCLVNGNSPVVLTKTADGVSARINVYGEAHYAADAVDDTPFVGLFNSPTTSFDTIAAFETYFNANKAIPALSYAASFTTTPVPEPEAFGTVCLGLLCLGLAARKTRKKSTV